MIAVRPACGTTTSPSSATPRYAGCRPTLRSHGDIVVADVDGSTSSASRDVVVLSAGAANSAKVLLASANDQHPHGLANGSDQVGRNYVFHNSRAFLAVSTDKNDTRFQKTLGLNDYYFGDADFDFPMGNVQMVGKSSAPMYRGEKPLESQAGTDVRAGRRRRARRRLLAVGRRPSRSGQPGDLDRDGDVVLSYTPNNQEPMEQLYKRVKKHLSHLGMHPHHLIPRDVYMKNDIPVAGCAHQAGTVRFGTRPGDVGAGHRLQGARGRQPVRRGHELLPRASVR